MRKIYTIMIVIAVMLIAVGCSKKDDVKPYRVGLVNFAVGKVFIVGAGGKETPASIGFPLEGGMKICTVGKMSLCELYIRDTAVKVFGDTVVDIEKLGYDKNRKGEQTVMMLENGRMFTRVVKKLSSDDRFEVKTATTTAAVRGTEFFISRGNSVSSVACLDGKMELREKTAADKKPVVLGDGEKAETVKGKGFVSSDISRDDKKTLERDAEVKPIEKSNRELFDKLDKNDTSALKMLRAKIKGLSGSGVDKLDKPSKTQYRIPNLQ